MRSKQVLRLVFTDDDAERGELERTLDNSREEIVDHYISLCHAAGRPLLTGVNSTPEERLAAVRKFLHKQG